MLLIDTQDRKILAVSSPEHRLSSPMDEWVKSGRAIWVTEVPNTPHDELAVMADGSVSPDLAKQSAKQAKKDAKAARKSTVKSGAAANSIATLRAVVLAIATDLGYQID